MPPQDSGKDLTALLPTGETIHLWHDVLERSAAEVAACAAVLSAEERVRAARLRTEELRGRFVAGRAWLRQVLGRCTGVRAEVVRLVYNEFGKPALAGGEVHFNISHSANRVLMAVSAEPVGVDLELIRELDYLGMARVGLSAEAQAELARAGAACQAVFFRLWTQHEARAKAGGGGLAGAVLPMATWEIDVGAGFVAAVATGISQPRFEWRKMRESDGVGVA